MLKIASIISYSSLDDLLIRLCIDNALKVSEQVIVTHCSHLYNGTRENTKTLKLLKKEYPMVDFVEYRWAKGPHSYFWHNIGRIKGREAVREELDWINTQIIAESYRLIFTKRNDFQFVKQVLRE